MNQKFKESLIEEFKKIVNELPDNFDQLVEAGGDFFDIKLEIYYYSEHDGECEEKFSVEVLRMEDEELMTNEEVRYRHIYIPKEGEPDKINHIEYKFNEIIPPPFKD
jgi:hypothetical protein